MPISATLSAVPRTASARLGRLARALPVMVVGAASVALFFRYQIMNGFTLLFSDRYDGVIEVSILEHWYNVVRGLAPWAQAGYFYPVHDTLGYNDGLLIFGLIHAAFRATGLDPFLSAELVNVTLRVIGFAAFYAVARRMLRLAPPWALLGAALFTIANNVFVQAVHVQLLAVGLVPLLGLLLHEATRALLEGRRRALLGCGAGFSVLLAACLMTEFYMAWYFLFFGTATLVALAGLGGRARRAAFTAVLQRQALPCLGLLVLTVALNIPFLTIYLPKAAQTGMHPWDGVLPNIPSPLDMVDVGPGNLLYGHLTTLVDHALRPDAPGWSERTTGMPLVLLVLFACGVVWLWRGRRVPEDRLLPRAIAVAAVATWLLAVQIGGVTAWRLVYLLVPGARAARVVARYQIFLDGPVIAVAMVFLAAHARRLPAALLFALCAVLVLEEINTAPPLLLDRPYQMAWLNAVPAPPRACRAFYVSDARIPRTPPANRLLDEVYSHNVDAMLVAEVTHLPTLNGFATFVPPGWRLVGPSFPGYPAAVRQFAEAHHVHHLCGLDLRSLRWTTAPKL